MTTEKKAYDIRQRRKPQEGAPLSGVVVIQTSTGTGTVNVSFSDKLVQAVGKLLPQGVSFRDPAYLCLMEWGHGWRLLARYLAQPSVCVCIARYDSPPVWAIKEIENVQAKKNC